VGSNFLDRIVGYINPKAGQERVRSRLIMEMLDKRSYEGAAVGRRTDGWTKWNGSARAATESAIERLRIRSRDLTRNNPYAAKALFVITNNVVGTGIVPRAIAGKRGNRATNVMDMWRAWAESTECDADGLHDFYGLQALVMRTVAESGECLIRRRWRRTSDGLTLPLQLQVLEPDFIDTSKDMLQPAADGTQLIQGIKFDALGKRTAYMLYNQHPGDNQSLKRLESSEVAAEDIIHVFRVDRPGQVRGVPWPAPVILRLRDFDDYEDAQLLRQKLAACYTAFVKDTDAGSLGPDGKQRSISETLEPGIIEILPPGKEIEFANPPGVTGYAEYATTTLRSIAAGYGVTYEAMTGDLSTVNFSSGRMGWLEFHRNVEAWRWNMLIPRMCDGSWAWFMEAASINGARVEGVTVQWTPPRREMIDPVAETRAAREAVRAGFLTLPEALRQTGQDPDLVLEEYAETAKKLDELGLVLESDPRRTTQSGQAQVDAGTSGSTNNESNNNA
jgi:lambda family phage portal protein